MTHANDANTPADAGKLSVWPYLAYRDAPAGIRFLVEAFGFVERARYEDAGVVQHAELAWSYGSGGVMLASTREGSEFNQVAGTGVVYVVTDRPDALFARATAAGAEVVRGLKDEDYGSRGFTIRDPEGNLWSFGTFGGE